MQPFDTATDHALHEGADSTFSGHAAQGSTFGASPHAARDAAARKARVYALEDELLRGLAPRRQRANLIAEREGITASHVRKILAERA